MDRPQEEVGSKARQLKSKAKELGGDDREMGGLRGGQDLHFSSALHWINIHGSLFKSCN